MFWPTAFVTVLIFMTVVMTLAWATQKAVDNSGWIDVFWTYGTGIAGAAVALWPMPDAAWPFPRQLLVAILVVVWAGRLGTYVMLRVMNSAEDARYVRYKKAWGKGYQTKLYGFILPQALITALLTISIMGAAWRGSHALDWRDAAGVAILAIAIGGESLADRQLAAFKRGATRKGAINDRGLWGWSRHPNYFFEWFGWLAYPVIAFDLAQPTTWLTWLAPVAMFGVLRFMTGVPPLEASMTESRGDAYRQYQARTSAFFLLPPRKG
jgi:steroid 5-alpha reductase family enzyme